MVMRDSVTRGVETCRTANAVVLMAMVAYFLVLPALYVIVFLCDSGLRSERMPDVAFRLHRTLSPRYERWAKERLASDTAVKLAQSDISGTEWPLFGSVFYLWSTESLQDAWDRDHSLASRSPREYARGAIEVAAALLADPKQAAWVQKHWGGEYLHRENVFYRMLLIGGLASHYRLLHDDRYLPLLRDQVETLSAELDASPHGLLDDYPNECYPGDVLAAIACIKRADAVLDTDHGEFIERERRAFEGKLLDELALPPYMADARRGYTLGPSRGCGNSYMCLTSPEVWPDRAAEWYAAYEKHFGQSGWAAGFREFARGSPHGEWYMDVDAGPVMAGYGVSANAFGVGAARVNGRFDHAWPLAAEMLTTSWPLLDGTLVIPRILSNTVNAPYLGEAGILYNLTRQPASGFPVIKGGSVPAYVYIVLSVALIFGSLVIVVTILRLRRWRRSPPPPPRAPLLQCALWVFLIVSVIVCACLGRVAIALLLLLIAQLLPRPVKSACLRPTDGPPVA
jgi:hypothetical protein